MKQIQIKNHCKISIFIIIIQIIVNIIMTYIYLVLLILGVFIYLYIIRFIYEYQSKFNLCCNCKHDTIKQINNNEINNFNIQI